MTESEATRFLRLFEKIDTDHSGTIDLIEFFTYFKLEENKFIEKSFNVRSNWIMCVRIRAHNDSPRTSGFPGLGL